MIRLSVFFLLSFVLTVGAFADIQMDSATAQRFNKLARNIRQKTPKLKEGQYEVRIWNTQALRYGDAQMLYVLKKTERAFIVSKYVIESDISGFRYAIKLKPTVPITLDLWERLLQQDLLTLPDEVTIENQLRPRQRKDSTWTTVESDGNVSVHAREMREEDAWIIIGDGEDYYFEVFSSDRYRGYSYSNPRAYLEHKPKITELRKVVTILNNLTVLFYSSR